MLSGSQKSHHPFTSYRIWSLYIGYLKEGPYSSFMGNFCILPLEIIRITVIAILKKPEK
jgi:hypothetical protein